MRAPLWLLAGLPHASTGASHGHQSDLLVLVQARSGRDGGALENSKSLGASSRQTPFNLVFDADSFEDATDAGRRQELRNFHDVQYFANVSIGGQVITGIIDTGSFELVVFERHCAGCGAAAKYNHSQSSTYSPGRLTRSLYYGSGDLYAREAFDTVSVGSFEKINQSFWESYGAYMPVLDMAQFQSIIGVGPPEMPASEAWLSTARHIQKLRGTLQTNRSHAKALESVVASLDFSLEMGKMPTLLSNYRFVNFSLCLGKRPGSTGFFTWNDTRVQEHPALFKSVPVIGRHTWTVNMTDVRLAQPSHSVSRSIPLSCQDGCGAIVDSGTSFLMLPSGVVDLLQDHLEGMGVQCANINDFPELIFTLGDHTFSLPPDAYVSKVTNRTPRLGLVASLVRVRELSFSTGACELSVMESTTTTSYGPLWILGMPFFRKYYTTFSLGRSREERALRIAKANSHCYPAHAETVLALDSGQEEEVFERQVDLSQAYISPLIREALNSSHIEL